MKEVAMTSRTGETTMPPYWVDLRRRINYYLPAMKSAVARELHRPYLTLSLNALGK